MSATKIRYTLIAVCLSLLSYLLLTQEEPAEYVSFGTLLWEAAEGCQINSISQLDSVSFVMKAGKEQWCKSKPLILKAPVLKVQYYIPSHVPGSVSARGSDLYALSVWQGKDKVKSYDLHSGRKDLPKWLTLYVDIPDSISEDSIWLEFRGEGLQVRNRIEFLTAEPAPLHLSVKGNFKPSLYKTLPISILLLIFGGVLLYKPDLSRLNYFLIVFSGTCLMFFSYRPFYYFDEWHVLERFKDLGFSGIWYPHNEHFLPLFFSWYYLVVSFLGDSYVLLLLLGFFLHSVHCFLLYLLFKELGFFEKYIRVFIFLYSVAAVHLEVLEWGFEQSIILSSISSTLAILHLKRFIATGKYLNLVVFFVSIFAAPVLFGNGFISLPLSFMVAFLYFLLRDFSALKVKAFRFFSALLGSAVVSVPAILLYLSAAPQGGTEHAVRSPSSLLMNNFIPVSEYILVGSGVGSILRGLGLYPHLGLSSIMEMVREYYPFMSRVMSYVTFSNTSFELSLSLIVHSALILFFLVLFLITKSRKLLFGYLVGTIFLLCPLLLPALARFSFGELQSLALRYQYQGLLGVVILVLSGVQCIPTEKSGFRRYFSKWSTAGVFLLLFFWIFIQVNLVTSFNYFRYHGEMNRIYVNSISDWNNTAGTDKNVAYEGTGTMQGLFPLHHPTITPGTHPHDILKTYVWLNGYPLQREKQE